ncbi:hypothetical protein BDV41DRAFT_90754 [Aspergillus transmontanensis]|uniref:Uncharacterized protein n=1 Tax=Aspergillus transmontanensis TaxID=1034304 RepID=A0A5N6VEP5_9EURO|nr:hypothetical protein BDV41DRAFT_90754 [Aspergillus transmontanensis]
MKRFGQETIFNITCNRFLDKERFKTGFVELEGIYRVQFYPNSKESTRAFFSKRSDIPTKMMKKVFASIGGSVSPMTQCSKACASTGALPRRPKIRIINVVFLWNTFRD